MYSFIVQVPTAITPSKTYPTFHSQSEQVAICGQQLTSGNPNPYFLHENTLSLYALYLVENFTGRMLLEQDSLLFYFFKTTLEKTSKAT